MSGSLNCFSFLTGLGIKANSTKCKSAILICLTAFSSDYPPISDLIHLARCVKFNPQFNPWIVLIGLRGTEFNRRINLLRGFGQFNLGLALIGFRTTGAWWRRDSHEENFRDVCQKKLNSTPDGDQSGHGSHFI